MEVGSRIPTLGNLDVLDKVLEEKDGMRKEKRITILKRAGIPDKYLYWTLLSYAEGAIDFTRLPLVFEYLSRFDTLLTHNKLLHNKRVENFIFNEKDINSYCGLTGCKIKYIRPGLKNWIDQYHSKDIEDINRARNEKNKLKEDVEKVFETPNVLIVHPLTQEASCIYGAGTKWCTAADKDNEFNEYNKQGPLYIVINKLNNKKYQLHFETSQFMDAKDEPVTLRYLGQSIPDILTWFQEDSSPITRENAIEVAVELGNVNLLKFFKKKFNLTVSDARKYYFFEKSDDYVSPLIVASNYGYIDILQSLIDDFNLTIYDVKLKDNYLLRFTAINGSPEILKFLNSRFNLTIEDYRANNNEMIINAIQGHNIDILRFLKYEIGLTTEDFRSATGLASDAKISTERNLALKTAVIRFINTDIVDKKEYEKIIWFLKNEVGLNKEDVLSVKWRYNLPKFLNRVFEI